MAIVKFSNKKPSRRSGRQFFPPRDPIGHFNQWDQFDPRDPSQNPPTFGDYDGERNQTTRVATGQDGLVSQTVPDKLSPQHGHRTLDQVQRVSPTLRRSRRGLPQPTGPQLRRSQRRLPELTPPQDNHQHPGPLQLAAPELAAPQLALPQQANPLLAPPLLVHPQSDHPPSDPPQPSHPQLNQPQSLAPQPGPEPRARGNNNTNTTPSALYQGVNRIRPGKKPMRGTGWTDEEDQLLLRLRAQNVPYETILAEHIPDHSLKGLQVRHVRMKKTLIITADGTTITAGEAAAAATNGENAN